MYIMYYKHGNYVAVINPHVIHAHNDIVHMCCSLVLKFAIKYRHYHNKTTNYLLKTWIPIKKQGQRLFRPPFRVCLLNIVSLPQISTFCSDVMNLIFVFKSVKNYFTYDIEECSSNDCPNAWPVVPRVTVCGQHQPRDKEENIFNVNEDVWQTFQISKTTFIIWKLHYNEQIYKRIYDWDYKTLYKRHFIFWFRFFSKTQLHERNHNAHYKSIYRKHEKPKCELWQNKGKYYNSNSNQK